MEVRGRTDTALTYSLTLPPGEAILLFDTWVDGSLIGAEKADARRVFRGMRLLVETGSDSSTYDETTVASVLRRWHKYIYAVEIK